MSPPFYSSVPLWAAIRPPALRLFAPPSSWGVEPQSSSTPPRHTLPPTVLPEAAASLTAQMLAQDDSTA